MGGEWWFRILENLPGNFSVEEYHKELQALKQRYRYKMREEHVEWADNKDAARESNVFARFTYECFKHPHWGDDGHKPQWILYWDPSKVSSKDRHSNIHARCAPERFKGLCHSIQRKLMRRFPGAFEQYWGDGFSGYGDQADKMLAIFGYPYNGADESDDTDDDERVYRSRYDREERHDHEKMITPETGYYTTGHGLWTAHLKGFAPNPGDIFFFFHEHPTLPHIEVDEIEDIKIDDQAQAAFPPALMILRNKDAAMRALQYNGQLFDEQKIFVNVDNLSSDATAPQQRQVEEQPAQHNQQLEEQPPVQQQQHEPGPGQQHQQQEEQPHCNP